MADDTKTDDGLAIELEQAKAILKVAYLLTAIDGTICEREQAQFRAIMKRLLGEHYMTPEGVAYVEDVAEEARKLLALRAFYTEAAEDKAFLTEDNAFLKVFAAKAAPSLATIVKSRLATRSAFAIWIGICCTDREYTPIERLAVKMLQTIILESARISSPFIITEMPPTLEILSAVLRGVICDGDFYKRIKEKRGDAILPFEISDTFLKELEKRILKICELSAKAEAATDDDDRQNYQDLRDFEAESLRAFVEGN